jgi:hypothetical protein
MLGVAATYLGPAERPPAITRMALPRLPARANRVSPRANDNTQPRANSGNQVPNRVAQAHRPGAERGQHLHGAVGRPAQRREPDDRGAALRAHPVLQRVLDELSEFDLGRFPAARAGERSNPYVAFLIAGKSPCGTTNGCWSTSTCRRSPGNRSPTTCSRTATGSITRRPGTLYADRVQRRGIPLRAQHGPPLVSREVHLRHGDSSSPTADPFFGPVFDASIPAAEFSAPPSVDRDDLLGGYPAPRRYIGWQTFFDFGDGQVKKNPMQPSQ